MTEVFQGSTETNSSWNHLQDFHMHMLMFWVFIEKIHLSPAHIFQDTRKPKSWIILQNNGMWSKIIHLLLETGMLLIHCY